MYFVCIMLPGPSLFESRAEDPKPVAPASLPSFLKAQQSERQALDHRLRFEYDEWALLQRQLLSEKEKEWAQEKQNIFKTVQGGTERRARMNQLDGVRKLWMKEQQAERERFSAEQFKSKSALDAQLKQELQEFQTALKRGETPPVWLWPESRAEKEKHEQSERERQPRPTPSLGPIQKP